MNKQNDYSALFRITFMNFLFTGVFALAFMTYLYISSNSLIFLVQVVGNLGSTVVFGMYALVLKKQADDKSISYKYGLGKFEALSTFVGFIIQDINLILLAVVSLYEFAHVEMDVSFGFLEFAYPISVVIYDISIIIILKKKSSIRNGIVKSQVIDCWNESIQLMVSLFAMALIRLFPNTIGIYKFQYIICLCIIGYTFYLSLNPIKRSVFSLLDKCVDEEVSQKIIKILDVHNDRYQSVKTYHTRMSANTTFIDVFVRYDDMLTTNEILQRNAKISSDLKKIISLSVVNCILIDDHTSAEKKEDYWLEKKIL